VAGPDDSFRRYLEAKRTVDRRARNRQVLDRFRTALESVDQPVDVCELGTGTGTMVERVGEWAGGRDLRYVAVDADPGLVEAAVEGVAEWARENGDLVEQSDDSLLVERDGGRLEVEFAVGEGLAYLADRPDSFDVVVGQAFLDLTDIGAAMEAVSTAVRPGGVGYFPITFDGVTALLPTVDPALDDRLERRFHRHMDATEKPGGTAGDSRAGRHLLVAVPDSGGEVLAAGGSDWVVTPTGGGYEADEAFFLHHLVDTIEDALTDDAAVADDELASWTRTRHDQIDAGELAYVAHQLDVLAGWPGEE
jgi:SAM-dependent methyltransferase